MGSILGGQGVRTRVTLVLRECIWNAPVVSFVLSAFDDAASLGSPPRQSVYPPGSMVPPLVTAFRFLVGNREAALKPTIFCSRLLFLSFLFSRSPSDIVPLSAACWGLLINNNNNNNNNDNNNNNNNNNKTIIYMCKFPQGCQKTAVPYS